MIRWSDYLAIKNRASGSIMIFLILVQLSLMIIILTSTDRAQGILNDSESFDLTRNPNGSWKNYRLWDEKKDLNDVVVGDVDSSYPGDEIVVGGESEKVFVLYDLGNTFFKEMVFKDHWYITAIAIGDVYPKHQGNEIVVVGWSTNVTMIYKSLETNEWVVKRLYDDRDWLYDVSIGDIDPTTPGNEIAVVGDPKHVLILSFSEETNSWKHRKIEKDSNGNILKGGFSVISIGNFDSEHKGNEMFVTGPTASVGQPSEILEGYYNYSSGKWDIVVIGEVENQPIEVAIGDFYSKHPGNECALVSIKRSVLLIYQNYANSWILESIWTDSESIQDVAIYDLVLEHDGNELVVAGYSNYATILIENQSKPSMWESITIFGTDTNLNGVSVGEFDALHHGCELAIIQSNRLIKVQFETPRFNLYTPQKRIIVPAGIEKDVPVIVSTEGTFKGNITLELLDGDILSEIGIFGTFSKNEFKPPELAILKLHVSKTTSPGTYKINILGTELGLESSTDELNLTLDLITTSEPSFKISVSPELNSVIADFSVNFKVETTQINNWKEVVFLNIKTLPPGVRYSFEKTNLVPSDSSDLTITTTSSTPVDRYFIIISAHSLADPSKIQTTTALLDLEPPKPDFYLKPDNYGINLLINSSAKLNIQSYSIFGFDEKISVSVEGLPEFVNSKITPEQISPPGNITLLLKAKSDAKIGSYNITIIGTSLISELERETNFQLNIHPEEPWFNISLKPQGLITVQINEPAKFELIIIPMAGFDDMVDISISGLETSMSWNKEKFPIKVNTQITTDIEIIGLSKPALLELTVVATGGNITIKRNINIDVIPEKNSEEANDVNNVYLQIIIIIIFLLCMIMLLSRLTKQSSREKKTGMKTRKSKKAPKDSKEPDLKNKSKDK